LGILGSGEVMEGAMQQAAQWGRQIISFYMRRNKSSASDGFLIFSCTIIIGAKKAGAY
jgi:hypothetical protein